MTTALCPKCGTALPASAPEGLCRVCLLEQALASADASPTQVHSPSADDAGQLQGSPGLGCFGDYELLEEIARGGMGVVYKARQKSLNRVVAVKLILAGQFAGKQHVQRFRGEATAAAILQHPNIVAVHEVGTHNGQHFFSMDYVEGQNLAHLVGNSPLPPQQAARYVKLISEAIHHAHQLGILHRDLKPSNVIIDLATDQPRVTDFGLAKRLDRESSITVTGQVLGSPNFMPPEQASGSRGREGRPSDVYGLGGILFYLLTARAPFQGATLETTIHEVLNTEPLAPRALNPSIPPDLETICLKCLEKELSRRYQTAQELADELGRFLSDEPIHARPISQVERAWRWCRRKPALAGSLAAAAVLLLIVAVGSPFAALRINREARRAEAGETAFRLTAYAADMNVAHTALQEHNLARVLQSLERWVPTNRPAANSRRKPSADLRGWEWRYLRSQSHSDERDTLPARHSGSIVSVAYSPDGKWLASASHDGRVKLFELATRRPLAELQHKKEVRAVAFSPRDSTIATLSADSCLRFWDATTHAELGSVPAYATAWAGAVAFSRDGTYIAFSSPAIGSVTISNLTLRTSMVIKAHSDVIGALAFSPDGAVLATQAWDNRIKLWDVETWQIKHVLTNTVVGICTVAFSPDSRQLVSTSLDQTWKLWDRESGQLLHTETSHLNSPYGALFLRDGKTIAVANDNHTISLWYSKGDGWKEQAVLKGHRASVWALAVSPDGNELASGSSADGEVKLWSTAPPSPSSNWLPCPAIQTPWAVNQPTFALSTDARAFLFTLRDKTIELWDSATLTNIATLTWPETNSLFRRFALHSDLKSIASGGHDGTIKLWHVTGQSLHEERSFKLNTHVLSQLAFSPNGKTLAAVSHGILLWDVASGQRLFEFDQEGTYSVKFSPDSKLIVSTGRDGTVKLWEIANRRCLWTRAHESTATDAAFFPAGQKIVTGAWVRKARMWDISGRELAGFEGQLLGADSVAVSPDGQRIAVGCGEGAVKLFMLDGSQQPLDVLTLPCQQNGVWRVAFLPDGETIIAACRGGVQVWRAPTIGEIQEKVKTRTSVETRSGLTANIN